MWIEGSSQGGTHHDGRNSRAWGTFQMPPRPFLGDQDKGAQQVWGGEMNQTLGLRKEAGRSEVGEQGPHPGFEQSFPLLHGLLQEPLHAGDIRVQAPTARGKRSEQMMAVPHLPSSPPSLLVPHPFLESQFIS